MKYNRFLSVFLSAIFLAGCVQPTVNSTDKFEISKENLPSVLNIFDSGAFDGYTNKKTDLAALNAWNTYMSEKYGTQIILQADLEPGLVPLTELQNGNMTGLIALSAGTILSFMETHDREAVILPLDEYLKDNKIWNSLPAEFRNRFEWNGHVWAIPKTLGNTLQVNCINTKWLEKVNGEMPTSLEGLKATGQKFMSGDANDNGLQDDYLLNNVFSENLCSAFGIYLNGYDPMKKTFVDPKTTEEFTQFFNYISDLYNEGLIDSACATTGTVTPSTDTSIYGTLQTPLAASKYSLAFDLAKKAGKTDDEILAMYDDLASTYEALPPLGDGNPQTYTDDDSCFVLAAGTEQPKEVVNTFVDIMFGSVEGNLDLKYGVPEHYRKGEDKVITLIYDDENYKTFYTYPNLVDNLDILDDRWVSVTPDQNKTLARKLKEDTLRYQKDYISRYTQSGQLQKLSVWQYIKFRNYGTMITTLMLESGEYYSTDYRADVRFDQWKSFHGMSRP